MFLRNAACLFFLMMVQHCRISSHAIPEVATATGACKCCLYPLTKCMRLVVGGVQLKGQIAATHGTLKVILNAVRHPRFAHTAIPFLQLDVVFCRCCSQSHLMITGIALLTMRHSRATPCRMLAMRMAPHRLIPGSTTTPSPTSMRPRRIPLPSPTMLGDIAILSL